MHVRTHTFMHACLRTYVHAYIHEHIQALHYIYTTLDYITSQYKKTYMHRSTCVHECGQTCIHTYICAYLRSYVHMLYIYTYLHACIHTHTCIHPCMHDGCLHEFVVCVHACVRRHVNTYMRATNMNVIAEYCRSSYTNCEQSDSHGPSRHIDTTSSFRNNVASFPFYL